MPLDPRREVEVKHVGAVAVIRLNRPEFHNAQTTRLLIELDEILADAVANDDIHAIVLLGKGPSFSAGHDLKQPEDTDERIRHLDVRRFDGSVEGLWEYEHDVFYRLAMNLYDVPKPTIVGVHGHVAIAGIMLAAMCDLVIAATDAKFMDHSVGVFALSMPEIAWHPWELGVRKAKEFLWTGAVWDAETMERAGLVNTVVPPDELEAKVMSIADTVSRLPPWAVMATKRSLNQAADLMGKRNHFEYHFAMHELTHATEEAQANQVRRSKYPTRTWLRDIRREIGFPHPSSRDTEAASES